CLAIGHRIQLALEGGGIDHAWEDVFDVLYRSVRLVGIERLEQIYDSGRQLAVKYERDVDGGAVETAFAHEPLEERGDVERQPVEVGTGLLLVRSGDVTSIPGCDALVNRMRDDVQFGRGLRCCCC